jgi:hypothetical protein
VPPCLCITLAFILAQKIFSGNKTTTRKMELLDFPPEIFQQVTHELVAAAGVQEAWKLRGVCRKL